METPKLGEASILCLNFIIQKRVYSERVEQNRLRSTRSEYSSFCIIKFKHKMDSTPSFGVSIISKVPSNPQLTLIYYYIKGPV